MTDARKLLELAGRLEDYSACADLSDRDDLAVDLRDAAAAIRAAASPPSPETEMREALARKGEDEQTERALQAERKVEAMRQALEKIEVMDPFGIRGDDLGRAARIASAALASIGQGKEPDAAAVTRAER